MAAAPSQKEEERIPPGQKKRIMIFLRVYQEMDDMKGNCRQAKEMAGNKCLKLYWFSTVVFQRRYREQLHSLIDREAVKVSIEIC